MFPRRRTHDAWARLGSEYVAASGPPGRRPSASARYTIPTTATTAPNGKTLPGNRFRGAGKRPGRAPGSVASTCVLAPARPAGSPDTAQGMRVDPHGARLHQRWGATVAGVTGVSCNRDGTQVAAP